MADIDDNKIELIERQIAEKVTQRVHNELFRLYATAGLAVIGVLGFVGWDVVSGIENDVKEEIIKSIEGDVGKKRADIAERVIETRYIATRASEVIQRVEKQLDDFQPQADNLNDTIDRVNSLNITSKDLLASYAKDVKPLLENVDALSNQFKILAEQVDQLNAIAASRRLETDEEPVQNSQQRSDAIKSVISDTAYAEKRLVEARNMVTVFFQFAGGRREQAEAISYSLKAKGFTIPSEERQKVAAGKREVRYFHSQDQQTAERLAKDVTTSLITLGYIDSDASPVKAMSFVDYRSKKPRDGIVELWLEIPPI